MSTIGNYSQRNYQTRFRSQNKPSWAAYNKAWTKRRQAAEKRFDQLSNMAYAMQVANTQASQANALFVMQNQGRLGTYASQTAAMARINLVV
jgi:2-oxo-4-hydroxy-4-carboxy--5-ureidoimidazoline (OHCU) decarboxylase